MKEAADRALRWLRRAVIFVLGISVTLVGVLLFFTPGPAIVVVPLGLMILATEFAWARIILAKLKEQIERMRPSQKTAEKAEVPQAGPVEPPVSR